MPHKSYDTPLLCVRASAPPTQTRHTHTQHGPHHPRPGQLGRRPRHRPPRGVGPRRRVPGARRGVAADAGVQGGAGGGKGVSEHAAGLVVCGGISTGGGLRDEMWRLDLATLRWGGMPSLVTARDYHSCCVVRGNLVVLGGETSVGPRTSSVEVLSSEEEEEEFRDLARPEKKISRRCCAARSGMRPRSRWKRARAPRGRCSCSEGCRVVQCRRFIWWIWPPACARPAGLTCSARAWICGRWVAGWGHRVRGRLW
jgi:hypothetical protein